MRQTHIKAVFTLSWLIVILAIMATLGGLLMPGLYRDTDIIKTSWLGNDLLTLLLVVPMLIFAMNWSKRGSYRAQLVWVGLLLYMLYNYAFYLFGSAFNAFFLLHVAIFTLSMYALFLTLYQLNITEVRRAFREDTPVRWISVFLAFLALPLLVVEGGQSIQFIFTGKVPEAPSLIFALDLSFVVPGTILAAILLWQRRAWGYVLAAMMLVKGMTYGLVLVINTAIITAKGLAPPDPLMPFYIFVAAGSLMFCWILLRSLNPIRISELY